MTGISAHVLDVSVGRPARDIKVNLAHKVDGQWSQLGEGRTDVDGRCHNLASGSSFLQSGDYRLIFDVAQYFESRQIPALYNEIIIAFQVRDPEQHYHIPLLLAPHGYTTYRGS